MKKILLAVTLLYGGILYGQNGIIWYDAIAVADKTYGNIHPRIVLDQQGKPLVLWADANGRAFIAKWNGKGFAPPMQINTPGKYVFAESWAGPEITNHGDTIYIVYKELPEDKSHIYIKHSYDGGKNFSIESEVDENPEYISRFPSVAIDPYGHPLVAYMKLNKSYTSPRYVVARSTDMGESFSGEATVKIYSGGQVSDCCPATVIESGNASAILYRDDLNGVRNIWAGMSANAGISFNRGVQIDTTNWMTRECPAQPPHGIIVSDTLYSVFSSGSGDSALIYLGKLSVSSFAASSAPVTGHIPGANSQNMPRIANSGNAAGLIWQQPAAGGTQLCLLFTSDITTGFPAQYDKAAKGMMLGNADLALGSGHLYLVWQDDSSGNVMCRVGSYNETIANQMLAGTTTISLKTSKSGKYFTVPLTDMVSCLMVDLQGKEYEMDLKCRKTQCRVYTEDLDAGLYIVRIFGKDEKVYTYKYEVKEEVIKD